MRILADAAEGEPTEPSKPGFVGFEGTPSAESPEIEAGSDPAELARASAVLNRAGVRIVPLEGGVIVRVWRTWTAGSSDRALHVRIGLAILC